MLSSAVPVSLLLILVRRQGYCVCVRFVRCTVLYNHLGEQPYGSDGDPHQHMLVVDSGLIDADREVSSKLGIIIASMFASNVLVSARKHEMPSSTVDVNETSRFISHGLNHQCPQFLQLII
jgi:hypothetical protein